MASAGTPWAIYPLPTMWEIVNSEDVDALWKQADGWKKTTELTSLNMYNIQQYKEQLAEAWPPGKSEASAAYMAELDKLITSIQETNEAASANRTAVVSLAYALCDAKRKLEPLYREYQSNAQKLADYELEHPSSGSGSTPTPRPSPGPSPVAPGRQEQLNSQARAIMQGISSEITAAGAALKPPTPYKPPMPRTEDGGGGGNTGGGASNGGAVEPLILPPPIAPPPPPSQSHVTPSTYAPTPPPSASGPALQQVGTLPPPPTMPPVIHPPVTPSPSPPPPPPGFGPLPVPPGPAPTGLPTTALPGRVMTVGPGGLGPQAGVRAMPPGGVIGGQPGAGLARPGVGGPVSRVNPAGGVIGGSGQARGGVYAPATRAGQQRDDERSQHWDPDNPWETEEGVTPVVLPPTDPRRFDPGPAIGQSL